MQDLNNAEAINDRAKLIARRLAPLWGLPAGCSSTRGSAAEFVAKPRMDFSCMPREFGNECGMDLIDVHHAVHHILSWLFVRTLSMPTYSEAETARDLAFDHIERLLGMRPVGVGLVPQGRDSYTIKVTLPGRPKVQLPAEIAGVPVEFDRVVRAPMLMPGSPAVDDAWARSASNGLVIGHVPGAEWKRRARGIPSITEIDPQQIARDLVGRGLPAAAVAQATAVTTKTVFYWLEGARVQEQSLYRLHAVAALLSPAYIPELQDLGALHRLWDEPTASGRTFGEIISAPNATEDDVMDALESLKPALRSSVSVDPGS